MTIRRLCRECGEGYQAERRSSEFCTDAHRKAFNNRRALRGAELYDLFMASRFDRDKAKAEGAWSVMCRMASHYHAEDATVRAGRPSWLSVETIKARHQYLDSVVVNSNAAGMRRR